MFTDEQVEAAVRALSDPERFAGAERRVAAIAPQLQRILAHALNEGGWFGEAHESQLRQALAEPDPGSRPAASSTLLAEETRMGMLIGVAVGWELARELETTTTNEETDTVDIRFLGQACFELTEGDTRVLVDPFLTGNPKAAVEASELEPTHIFLTHGHADHYGDVVEIAKRTGAPDRGDRGARRRARRAGCGERGRPEPGRHGRVRRRLGAARARVAHLDHAQGTVNTPAGLVISIGGKIVYHLGDTCLFSDLRLVGSATRSTWRSCASAATTRWTATMPRSPRSGWARAP